MHRDGSKCLFLFSLLFILWGASAAAEYSGGGGGGMAGSGTNSNGGGNSGGGGGGGDGVGFPIFGMKATSLVVPPAQKKTPVTDGIGRLGWFPHVPLTIPALPTNEQAVQIVESLMNPAAPVPMAPPAPRSGTLASPGASTGIVLSGLTDNTASVEKAVGVPSRGLTAQNRLLASATRAASSPKAIAAPLSPATRRSGSKGIVSQMSDGFIRVFRSIRDTYGWNPGDYDNAETAHKSANAAPAEPTTQFGGHRAQ